MIMRPKDLIIILMKLGRMCFIQNHKMSRIKLIIIKVKKNMRRRRRKKKAIIRGQSTLSRERL